jgi:integrase
MRQALTDLTVRSLKPPASGQCTVLDATLPGFGVRVSQGGTKTFTLMHGPERKLTTIGRFPILSLAQARKKARDILAAKQLGIYQEPPKLAFTEAYRLFLAAYKSKNRPKTVYEMERLVSRHLMPKFKHQALAQIATNDVATLLDKLLPTPAECKAVFTAARTIFRWASGGALSIDRRSRAWNHPPSQSRDGVLSDAELVEIFSHAIRENSIYGDIIQLLVLTGQRVNLIAKLRGEFIDREENVITWPAELMKGKRCHSIPYGTMAAAIFSDLAEDGLLFAARGRETAFNGFSKSKASFDKQLKNVAPYTLHDIRRTFATRLARLRVPPHVKEIILAHSAAKDPVEAIYDRWTYEDEKRDAVHAWENHLHALLSKEEDHECQTATLQSSLRASATA